MHMREREREIETRLINRSVPNALRTDCRICGLGWGKTEQGGMGVEVTGKEATRTAEQTSDRQTSDIG
jgi:hypothetical protein